MRGSVGPWRGGRSTPASGRPIRASARTMDAPRTRLSGAAARRSTGHPRRPGRWRTGRPSCQARRGSRPPWPAAPAARRPGQAGPDELGGGDQQGQARADPEQRPGRAGAGRAASATRPKPGSRGLGRPSRRRADARGGIADDEGRDRRQQRPDRAERRCGWPGRPVRGGRSAQFGTRAVRPRGGCRRPGGTAVGSATRRRHGQAHDQPADGQSDVPGRQGDDGPGQRRRAPPRAGTGSPGRSHGAAAGTPG